MEKKDMYPEWGESKKYEDLIGMEYPLKNHDGIRYPRMPVADRAKIFSPFSALQGYSEALHQVILHRV